MKLTRISIAGFGANTYVLTTDGKNAVVIDPSQPQILKELNKLSLTPVYVLLTHCHFDHVYGVPVLQAAGAKVICSAKEKSLVGTSADMSRIFSASSVVYTVDQTMDDNEERSLCNLTVRMLWTPGHTKGGACYLITDENGEEYLFTGDTLFAGAVGRTDFATGDISSLRRSLKRLSDLDKNYRVYPGHGDETTLETERKNNTFMVEL